MPASERNAERSVTVTPHGALSFGEGCFGFSLIPDGKGYLETDFSGGKGWWAGFTFYFWLKLSGHPSPVSIGESVLFAGKRFGSVKIGTVLSLITHRNGAPDTVKPDVRGRSGDHAGGADLRAEILSRNGFSSGEYL